MTSTSAHEGLNAMGIALWPYRNRTLGKMSGATVSRHRKAGSTGLRSGKAGEPTGAPTHCLGVTSEQQSRTQEVLLSSGHRCWLLGSSRRLDISGQNAERYGAVDGVPDICRGSHQVFVRVLVHIGEETL